MPRVLVILSPGFEEIEAITVIDLLRRAEIEVTVAGLKNGPVEGSHKITVLPDVYFKEVDHSQYDLLVLPGGQPGTNNMKKTPELLQWLRERFNQNKPLAAICAAPTVLKEAGIAKNLTLTSYPSEKEVFDDSHYLEQEVVEDGIVTTSRGVGTAIPFALHLIARLKGPEKAREVAERILYQGSLTF